MMRNGGESISGLWAELSGFAEPLMSEERLEALFKNAVSWGVSDLYLQVFREGRAWYPSAKFEQGCTWDTIGKALSLAKAHSIRLHAWINALNLGRNENSALLSTLGQDALLTDSTGVRIDQYSDSDAPPDERGKYFTLDAPKLWLDAGVPEVRAAISSVAKELVTLYPALYGVHLDFIRYPYLLPIRPGSGVPFGFDFGYGERTKLEYQKTGGKTSLDWDNFRRGNIDELVAGIRSAIGNGYKLSTAVIAWPDRAYLSAFQNWRKWLLEEMVDQVCPMSYTSDMELFKYLCRQANSFTTARSKALAGIGVYHFRSEREIQNQIEIARSEGTMGHIIFSYGNLLERGWRLY